MLTVAFQTLAVLLVAAFIVVFIFVCSAYKQINEKFTEYKLKHPVEKGVDPVCGPYQLRSFDGGNHWYAVSPDSDENSVEILGHVEQIYPELLKRIQAQKELQGFMQRKGFGSLKNVGDVEYLLEIVKDAGYVAKTGPKQ